MTGKIIEASKQGGGDNKWLLTVEVFGAQARELILDNGMLEPEVVGSKRKDADLKSLVGESVSVPDPK